MTQPSYVDITWSADKGYKDSVGGRINKDFSLNKTDQSATLTIVGNQLPQA